MSIFTDVTLAIDFADKEVIKPICLAWTYNFIHEKNHEENDLIWNRYLHRHPTIVCNQVVKILYKRKEIEKLRQFLNFEELEKKLIVPSELGKAYSSLLDGLLHKGDNNAVIAELKTALTFVSVKDFKPIVLNRIKLSSKEFNQQFWSVINNSPKIIKT